ncbi:unnamed protein product [Camellia sinensis]
MESRLWIMVFVLAIMGWSFAGWFGSEPKELVLNLDHSNFYHTIGNHDFIVVHFYVPGCSFCQKLAPEYEKAASVLSSHDPPVTLAKVDVSEEKNMDLAREFKISSFPTIKIFRMGENHIQDYQGPTRDAEGIVAYLKKQIGSSSAAEIEESAEDYQGPRDADGIVPYLKKKLIGSASAKIEESTEDFDLDMYINVI